jgi:type IV secretory pathway component VirB8
VAKNEALEIIMVMKYVINLFDYQTNRERIIPWIFVKLVMTSCQKFYEKKYNAKVEKK